MFDLQGEKVKHISVEHVGTYFHLDTSMRVCTIQQKANNAEILTHIFVSLSLSPTFILLFLFTHNPPPPSLSSLSAVALSPCAFTGGVPFVLYSSSWSVSVGVCAPWRVSFVLWWLAAQPLCSAASPVPSCSAAVLSNHHAFAFSGPIKLWGDVPVQVRHYVGHGYMYTIKCQKASNGTIM